MPGFEDWQAICETKARYCRCMDTKDWLGWADVFTEDLVLDSTPAGGYRIEGLGAQLFSAVDGNNFVVQGLPLFPLLDFLQAKRLLILIEYF